MKRAAKIFLSLFYSGYFPRIPGTFASMVSLILIYLLSKAMAPLSKVNASLLLCVLFATVLWLSYEAIKKYADKNRFDQSWIVIDEFLGMMIASLPIFYLTEGVHAAAIFSFILFRFFDIVKPLGIKAIDDKNSAFSVLMDDILAGIYSLICLLPICFAVL